MAHDHLPPAQRPPERAGYDALHGWDTSIHAEPEEVASDPRGGDVLGGDLLDEADVGVEWGPEGALARTLLAAALTDVAPSPLRERVLLAVDSVLREPVAVPAFPADAAPVTTLSGVFEKRRPTTESASCIEASPAGVAGAVERHAVPTREVASHEGVPSPEQALVGSGACTLEVTALQLAALDSACLLESDDSEGVSLESAPVEEASFERKGSPDPSDASATAASGGHCSGGHCSGGHCSGGPRVGGRCRNTSRAVGFAANPITSSPVTSSPVTSSPVTSSRVALNPMATSLRSGPFRVGVDGAAVSDAARATLGSGSASTGPRLDAGAVVPMRDVAVESNLDVPLSVIPLSVNPLSVISLSVIPLSAVPLPVVERSTSARLRDGVVASAFNLAQLAAAIVVGIVIGKAAHLIMADESATAWNPSAESEGGLRAEPSRIPDSARASEPLEATEALDGIEPRRPHRAPRTRAASAARAPSRSPGSARPARAANARPAAACTLASAQVASATALPSALPATALPATVPAPPGAALAVAGLGCPPVARVGGSWAPQPTNLAAVAPAPVAPLEAGQRSRSAAAADLVSPRQPTSDDWLGEQLAILGQAERSLLEDDPESAVRSLEVYEARFPDGLLDPQMASVRQRVEERFTAFIFP
jgi:hypothetical protein